MLNTIKMDLYRMFRTKSLYVIWIILAAVILFTTYLCTLEMPNAEPSQTISEEQTTSADTNIGMSIMIPTDSGKNVTLYDMFFANCQGKALALFFVIFSILFATADLSSGYIKNIAGQIPNRSHLVLSKTVCLFLYTILSMLFFLVIQGLSNFVCLGCLEIGNIKTFALYFLIQTLLHFALVLIVSTIAIILRNNVISMIIGVCLCMNVTTVLYSGIDTLVRKAGIDSFHLLDYTVTGKISTLPINLTTHDSAIAAIIAFAFSVTFTIVCSVIFTKKDIH